MAFFIFIFFFLLLIYCFIIHYYRRAWKNIPEFFPETADTPDVTISVVIALRNEEERIPELAKYLIAQQYPAELIQYILVDDHSSDSTFHILNNEFAQCNNVQLLQLPPGIEGKKHAIAFGVQHASGELIVTTDGDCHVPPQWLDIISQFYSSTGAKFIAAPVKMTSSRSLVGIFQKLDFMTMQGITGASVSRKLHMMCNGANLAYTRSAFNEVNGFEGIDTIPSGDDMLLMYKIYERYPGKVFYLKNKEAVVETPAEPTIVKFLNQRIRWASKSVHYPDKKIFFILLLTWVVNACFVILTCICVVDNRWWWLILLLFLMKLLVEFPFVNTVASFFNEQKLLKYFPVLQPLHVFYIVVSGWFGRFGTYEWKRRRIKNKGTANLSKL